MSALNKQNLSGNHRAVVPPDPIPNSEVKHSIADGSVGSPHARVGHFQAPNLLFMSSFTVSETCYIEFC